ncbi:membrane protein insertase YidC [Xylella taiwanensis]|uniref:Membrane protein insertase YidC n=1 Tax=Xylella taiwanensis TaxID=1444770 RepID=Z9JNA9_9GAMM|nr:membrane protein insertase YidC [Xylella taiwanensis]AXI84558.1 insertase [Xylella taiwanensis]EWS79291.1 insertase [Xylella taiwanensis]MCD8455462.1 membrane protein insertase YidC [Xylella taiwanensis]MCD8457867.1 membrane protein insertase YidC [Xylella taiwanensis]MCD8460002.1 membrane protein insertase YidC [Xylella taiwanensis]
MNQTRVFLIFSWLVVATLLCMEWGKNKNVALEFSASHNFAVHSNVEHEMPQVKAAASTVPLQQNSQLIASDPRVPVINVTTDVLQLKLDGFSVLSADLLRFPQSKDGLAQPVKLLTDNPSYPYSATSGWMSQNNSPVPSLSTFRPEQPSVSYNLAQNQNRLVVPFIWTAANGVSIRRTFSFERGSYAIVIKDEVYNGGEIPWSAYVFRKLSRVPNILNRSMTNPDSFSFNGAVWYSEKGGYERRAFKDYMDDGGLNREIVGGWIALLQHHFFTAWIPQKDQASLYLLAQDGSHDIAELRGPAFSVAPGQSVITEARLWVGPKLVDQIAQEQVKGLDRVVDYSRFQLMAVIGQGLFWILNHLNSLLHNWGWAIVGLVVLLRIVMYPLSAAQYKSAAKMRKFQPRLQQLKERYGEDRQKFQQAMMELYKKEKINPMGGCLPIVIQMPIFFALYWVLVESVELRQAPWLGWIQDLTTRDPYFILPILNIAIMWTTQKLTPTPAGMDPMSERMMQLMPLIFGVMMAFVPSGLALYWVINGGLNLLIQWWMIRQNADFPRKRGKTNIK